MTKQEFETLLIHSGAHKEDHMGAVTVPIYQTATFCQREFGVTPHFEYSRSGNPTREALEEQIAILEEGAVGLACASGMGALTTAFGLLASGDEVLLPGNVYGGSYRLLSSYFVNFGISWRIVDTCDLAAVEASFTPKTKAVLLESPTNPLMSICDIAAISEAAHRHGAYVVVDNTFLSPYLQRPLPLGADISVHSATKYIGGHSDVIAGLLVANTAEMGEKLRFIQNTTGSVLAPLDSYLLLRGLKTLAVRMDRHVENAQAVARWLAASPKVDAVYYPGLESHPGYAVQQRQAEGPGGMLSFELGEACELGAFFGALRVITLAESLGSVESLICHPATMTHAAIPAPVRAEMGISDRLVRLSVGIENKASLIADLSTALNAGAAG